MTSLLATMTSRSRLITDLDAEDQVQLFPSLASRSGDGKHWMVNVHGDVSGVAGLSFGKRMLLKLLQRPELASKSWDTLCHRYLAQRVAQKSIGDELKKLEIAGRVSAERRLKFNDLRQQIDRDLAAIAHELSFVSPKSEWPKILADSNGFSQVESDLTAAAGKLRELQNYVEQDR